MNQLNRLTSLVRKGDSISLTFKGIEAGTQILITPSLRGVSADEADETTRELIAALASPFVIVVPAGENVAESLGVALDTITAPRASAVEAYDSYVHALNDAAARAKTAAAQKAKTPSATPNGGKPAPATTVAPVSADEDVGDQADTPAAAATDDVPATSPAVAEHNPTPSLFDLD